MHVPQRWFNAYAGYRGETNGLFADPHAPQTKEQANSIKEGDLLVHHAGHKSLRAQRMSPWMDVAEQHLPSWEADLEDTTYVQEIADFWKNEAPKERKVVDGMIKKDEKRAKEKAEKKEAEAAKKKAEEEAEATKKKPDEDAAKKKADEAKAVEVKKADEQAKQQKLEEEKLKESR
jgi:hypothetical protein